MVTSETYSDTRDALDHRIWGDPVGLDEIDAAASLQTRVDRKYVLEQPHLISVLDQLGGTGCLGVLEIDGARWFEYESLYFDTPDRMSFRLAAYRHRHRYKVRIRSYVAQGTSMLEVKTKDTRGRTVKDRQPCLVPDDAVLSTDGLAFVDDILGPIGISPTQTASLEPVIATRYLRSTAVIRDARDASARVTIDRHLGWATPGSAWQPITDQVIVETKSAGPPTSMDHALWAVGVRPRRISKFALAMLLHDPTLPANRWHRILQGHCVAG